MTGSAGTARARTTAERTDQTVGSASPRGPSPPPVRSQIPFLSFNSIPTHNHAEEETQKREGRGEEATATLAASSCRRKGGEDGMATSSSGDDSPSDLVPPSYPEASLHTLLPPPPLLLPLSARSALSLPI
ncbi:hypothetical protein PR202_gb11203 [Eleusine coracana subsp. coracana]|uniref:Uncharacterized protein n=1 Tax=Eleusine coracana subsp. coracana TaxID=191504 RepID=A0AAV5EK03_ELECO|nr:hypothetical protein PR202_gb11203 [Eleusine coracana subsp. coracana]